MCKTNIYKTFIFCLALITTNTSFAQDKATVQATTDKNKILIGERIKLTLEAQYPLNRPTQFFSIDSIPHFVIVATQKMDTAKTAGGISLKQAFIITSFDSGHWEIPSFVLSKKIQTNPIQVDVTFSDFDPTQNYHDIKNIIEVNPTEEKKYWWYFLAGGVILLVILIILFLKKKKKPEITPVLTIDPYKEAMDQLEQIKKTSGTDKEYYSALINTFRLYIFRSKGIHSLQETTSDLVMQLKTLKLDKSQFEQLSQVLRLSDFVKFAKYTPSKEDNSIAFEAIKRSIQLIEQNK